MDGARTANPPAGELLGDFVSIEEGTLVQLPEDAECAWVALDDISLQVHDAGGCVSVVGELRLQELDPCRPAAITVAGSHSGGPDRLLRLALSLYNHDRRAFDLIGTVPVAGGGVRHARFETRFDPGDGHVGQAGEIRFRLSVSAPSHGERYVFSIHAVTLAV